jgi:hypothetical protein
MVRRPGSHGRTDGIAVYRLQRPAIDGSENRTFAMVARTASLRREFAPGGRAARVTHTLPWLAVTAVPPGVHFSIFRCPSGRGSGIVSGHDRLPLPDLPGRNVRDPRQAHVPPVRRDPRDLL